jgi:ABC-type branched-subunit amino acid transport system substrate-binding protein
MIVSLHDLAFASMPGIRFTAIAFALMLWVCTAGAQTLEVDIGFAGATDSDAWHGAAQGLAEANAQGQFLGVHYELVPLDTDAGSRAVGNAAVVAALDPAALGALARAQPRTPVFNVSAEDDALRADCHSNILHTIPSTAMRADAVMQWQRKHPQSAAVAQAWHEDFEKYAAVQLNRRYLESTGRPMNDVAWAAWAAVKLVSDLIVRLQDADPAALLAALKGPLAFDGQKGVDMSFRDTGQLRQTLLLVENGAIVAEAPVRGVVDPDDLDSLGLSPCQP